MLVAFFYGNSDQTSTNSIICGFRDYFTYFLLAKVYFLDQKLAPEL